VAVVDRGEQVVLNLKIQAAHVEVQQVAIWGYVMTRYNLVNVEVLTVLVVCLGREVVDLTANHEMAAVD
jgi:hypothetical protein